MSTVTPDIGRPAHRAGVPRVARRSETWCAAAAALAIGWSAAHRVDPDTLSGAGLLTAVHPTLWPGLLLLAAAAGLALRRDTPGAVRLCITLLMVFGVYGLQAAVYEVPRGPITWLHWGLTDQIAEHGQVLTGYDARFSWPGFFSATAAAAVAGGIGDPSALLRWAPLVLGGFATGACWLLADALFAPRRLVWLSTWLFTAANSVAQEYFSPQGLTMPVVLVTVACVVRFGGRSCRRPWATTSAVTLAALALAPAHQLSPLFLVLMLLVLAGTGRLAHWWLPGVPAFAVLAWWATGAQEFWVHQYAMVTGEVGDVSGSLAATFSDRIVGSEVRKALIGVRILSALLVVTLAGTGLVMLWRRRDPLLWVLAGWGFLPFAFVAVQSYGGEMMLRCFLFALPALAMAAAVAVTGLVGLLARRRRAPAWCRSGLCWVTAGTLAPLLVTTVAVRGQDDAFYSYSVGDRAVAEAAYSTPPRPATIGYLSSYLPNRFDEIDSIEQRSLAATCSSDAVRQDVFECVLGQGADRIVISPATDRFGQVMYARPPGWTDEVAARLLRSGQYRQVWHRDGAWVLDRVERR